MKPPLRQKAHLRQLSFFAAERENPGVHPACIWDTLYVLSDCSLHGTCAITLARMTHFFLAAAPNILRRHTRSSFASRSAEESCSPSIHPSTHPPLLSHISALWRKCCSSLELPPLWKAEIEVVVSPSASIGLFSDCRPASSPLPLARRGLGWNSVHTLPSRVQRWQGRPPVHDTAQCMSSRSHTHERDHQEVRRPVRGGTSASSSHPSCRGTAGMPC